VAGSKISPNTPVNLVVSEGKGAVAVPDVIGKWHKKAAEVIEEAGLTVGRIRYRYDEDYSGGRVLSQNPRADTEVQPGESIDLVVNESD
jgi:serine/threonine-protein kinase